MTIESTFAPGIHRPLIGGREIYIDGEWFLNQQMYLLGYAFNLRCKGWLFGKELTRKRVQELLRGVETIYLYGPDVAMLEKCFNLHIKSRYRCINLLRATRRLYPHSKHLRLCDFEKRAGIRRTTMEYKTDIFNLHRDWNDPKKRIRALIYNQEDVLNLIRIKRWLYHKHHITRAMEDEWRLLPKK